MRLPLNFRTAACQAFHHFSCADYAEAEIAFPDSEHLCIQFLLGIYVRNVWTNVGVTSAQLASQCMGLGFMTFQQFDDKLCNDEALLVTCSP